MGRGQSRLCLSCTHWRARVVIGSISAARARRADAPRLSPHLPDHARARGQVRGRLEAEFCHCWAHRRVIPASRTTARGASSKYCKARPPPLLTGASVSANARARGSDGAHIGAQSRSARVKKRAPLLGGSPTQSTRPSAVVLGSFLAAWLASWSQREAGSSCPGGRSRSARW